MFDVVLSCCAASDAVIKERASFIVEGACSDGAEAWERRVGVWGKVNVVEGGDVGACGSSCGEGEIEGTPDD